MNGPDSGATRRPPPVTPPDLPAVPPGSRWEQLVIVLKLAGDLLSVPFHFVVFLFTSRRHRRDFRRVLSESAR